MDQHGSWPETCLAWGCRILILRTLFFLLSHGSSPVEYWFRFPWHLWKPQHLPSSVTFLWACSIKPLFYLGVLQRAGDIVDAHVDKRASQMQQISVAFVGPQSVCSSRNNKPVSLISSAQLDFCLAWLIPAEAPHNCRHYPSTYRFYADIFEPSWSSLWMFACVWVPLSSKRNNAWK